MVPVIGPHLIGKNSSAYFEDELGGTHCILFGSIYLFVKIFFLNAFCCFGFFLAFFIIKLCDSFNN